MHLSLGAHVLFIGPERFNLDAGATAKKNLSTYIYVCILKNYKFIFFLVANFKFYFLIG